MLLQEEFRAKVPPFRPNQGSHWRDIPLGRAMFNTLRVISVALGLLLAGCIPVTTKTPVGSTAGFKNDPGLAGVWQGKVNEGGDTATLAFLSTDEGMVAVMIGTPMSNGKIDSGGFYASYALKTAMLGHNRYINAHELIEDGKPAKGKEAEGTFPVLYSMAADGTLVLTLVDEDAAKEAVNSGKIAGTVEKTSYGDVALTGTPAALDRYFSSAAGRALFKKPFLVLHRVK